MNEDAYVRELQMTHRTAVWVAELSNGEQVVQDDNRPGVEPYSAWIRLGAYVKANGCRIVRLWIKFWDNVCREILPLDAEGYFFCKSVIGTFGMEDNLEFYLFGYLKGETIHITRWKVPELLRMEEEERPAQAGPCLIVNPPH